MKLQKKISRTCQQAAVGRYVRCAQGRLIPLPPSQRLQPGQVIHLTLNQN